MPTTTTYDTATDDFTASSHNAGDIRLTFHTDERDVVITVDRATVAEHTKLIEVEDADRFCEHDTDAAYATGYDNGRSDADRAAVDVVRRFHDEHHGVGSLDTCYDQPCKDTREADS